MDMLYQRLTERECRAIRLAEPPLGAACGYDHANMRLLFKDEQGPLAIPEEDVRDYRDAWRKSGLWSLHGRKSD